MKGSRRRQLRQPEIAVLVRDVLWTFQILLGGLVQEIVRNIWGARLSPRGALARLFVNRLAKLDPAAGLKPSAD